MQIFRPNENGITPKKRKSYEQLEKENAALHIMIGKTDKLARERFKEYRTTIQELAEALDDLAGFVHGYATLRGKEVEVHEHYKALAAKHLEVKDEF